ncbi:Clp protease N-terminal domain-containing protein [Kineosporia succinea]|uniref:Clp R domain-containing protein n=1 Tax=Kineosporia succinea TaxID=84632 RepID=A0ABT9NYS0_9ACTN|nr:Clp protease N-terminal domain-containing protein [Kineosporia succinea]MDP9825565.1 hypothetical protein [Kineosporia succinea]
MTDSSSTTQSVRLDDLIQGIKKTHTEPLEQLTGAVVVGDYLGEVADHLIGHFVDEARRSGASWADIGRSLGVSKQAAQKRFVPKGDSEPVDTQDGFSRFTPRARTAVAHAHTAAQRAGNVQVAPAHLILGLAHVPDTLALRALAAQGVAVEALVEAATATLPAGGGEVPALIPFDGASKKVLELTMRTALRKGHAHVGTEHILLALAEYEDGRGVLASLGASTERLEADIDRILAELTP